jgi:hypothetical protein
MYYFVTVSYCQLCQSFAILIPTAKQWLVFQYCGPYVFKL